MTMFAPPQHPPRADPRKITRAPSPTLAYVTPWLTIMLGSVAPGWLLIAAAPMVPPLGLLLLLCWRQVRPGLLPVWAGLPLGLFDDLFSGQPLGSAIVLWTASMLVLDFLEFRFPWRNFVVDWMVASALIVVYVGLTTLLANAGGGATPLVVSLPQLALAILLYPLIGRMLGTLDRMRLTAFRVFG